MSYDEDFEGRGRTFSLPVILGGVALLAAIGIALFAYASVKTQGTKVSLLETDVRELEGRLESFRLADKELKGRVQGAEGKLRQKDAGQAPLAAKRRTMASAPASWAGPTTAGHTSSPRHTSCPRSANR